MSDFNDWIQETITNPASFKSYPHVKALTQSAYAAGAAAQIEKDAGIAEQIERGYFYAARKPTLKKFFPYIAAAIRAQLKD